MAGPRTSVRTAGALAVASSATREAYFHTPPAWRGDASLPGDSGNLRVNGLGLAIA